MAALLKLLVQVIQKYVRKQRAQGAALLFRPYANPLRQNSGTPDEPENALVIDLAFHTAHQYVVVDSVEEFCEIEVYAPATTRGYVVSYAFDRVVGSTSRSIRSATSGAKRSSRSRT